MFDNPYSAFPSPYQCEVLVFNNVSLQFFKRINFQRDEDRQAARSSLRGFTIPEEHRNILPIGLSVSPHLYPPRR